MISSPPLAGHENLCKVSRLRYWYLHCTHAARRLLKSTDDYELRLYDVYPFVTTPYERRDEGYIALGSYMEGENAESVKMNMTQPIMMRYEPATVSCALCIWYVAYMQHYLMCRLHATSVHGLQHY